jgi:hypothetical protein
MRRMFETKLPRLRNRALSHGVVRNLNGVLATERSSRFSLETVKGHEPNALPADLPGMRFGL